MSSSVYNIPFFMILPLDGGAADDYALGRRGQWDRKDFESLFDPSAGGHPDISRRGATAKTSEPIEQPGTADSPEADASRAATSDNGSTVPRQARGQAASTALAPTFQNADQGRLSGYLTAAQPELSIPQVHAESAAEPLDANAPLTSRAAALPPPIQVALRLEGQQATIAVRDATIPLHAYHAVRDLLRAHFSWRGLSIAELKINGQSVMPRADSEMLNSATGTATDKPVMPL